MGSDALAINNPKLNAEQGPHAAKIKHRTVALMAVLLHVLPIQEPSMDAMQCIRSMAAAFLSTFLHMTSVSSCASAKHLMSRQMIVCGSVACKLQRPKTEPGEITCQLQESGLAPGKQVSPEGNQRGTPTVGSCPDLPTSSHAPQVISLHQMSPLRIQAALQPPFNLSQL